MTALSPLLSAGDSPFETESMIENTINIARITSNGLFGLLG
jgi:hypothetical protein